MKPLRLIDNNRLSLHSFLKEAVEQDGYRHLRILTGYLYENGWRLSNFMPEGSYIQTISSPEVDRPTAKYLTKTGQLPVRPGIRTDVRIFPSNTDGFLRTHGKLFILSHPDEKESQIISPPIAIIGSSNLTAPGLGIGKKRNLELNWIVRDPDDVQALINYFQKIWRKSQLAQGVSLNVVETLRDCPSQVVFEQLIPGIFNYSRQIQQRLLDDQIKLQDYSLVKEKDYQKDAIDQIDSRLSLYGCCYLADDVGLGKTVMGVGILKRYILRALKDQVGNKFSWNYKKSVENLPFLAVIICPKQIENQWYEHIKSVINEVVEEVLDKEKKWNQKDLFEKIFKRVSLLTYGQERAKDFMKRGKEFKKGVQLLIVDEAHRLRNQTQFLHFLTEISDHLRYCGSRPDYLFQTATPMNNSFLDLCNSFQLALAPEFWKRSGIPDIKAFLREMDRKFDKSSHKDLKKISSLQGKIDREF